LVSIGMPVFNGARYVRQAVESVLSQTWGEFELIISDNDSTDSTAALCREYEFRDPRVRLICQPKNLGLTPNWIGLPREARGELFAWLAHDDWWAPEFLASTVGELTADPALQSAFSHVQLVDENGAPQRVLDLGFLDCRPPRSRFDAVLAYARFGKDYHTYGIHRRALLNRCLPHWSRPEGSFFGRSVYAGGVFTHSLVLDGAFAIVPRPLFHYRVHSVSLSRGPAAERRALLAHLHYSARCLALYAGRAPAQFGVVRGTHICYKLAKVHWRALWRLARAL
jgi:glycosyltransferase involved in cell wall biosynthesis